MAAFSVQSSGGSICVNVTCLRCQGDPVDPADIKRIAELINAEVQKLVAAKEAPKEVPMKKLTRRQTGCLTCRARRVRCDEIKPVCSGCQKNPNRVCRYDTPTQLAPRPKPKLKAASQSMIAPSSSLPVDLPASGLSVGTPMLRPQHQPQDVTHSHKPRCSDAFRSIWNAGLTPAHPEAPLALDSPLPSELQDCFASAFGHLTGILQGPRNPNSYTSRTYGTTLNLWNAFFSNTTTSGLSVSDSFLLHAALSLGIEHLTYFQSYDTGIRSTSKEHRARALQIASREVYNPKDARTDRNFLTGFGLLISSDVVGISLDWQRNIDVIRNFVMARGGPAGILKSHAGSNDEAWLTSQLTLLCAAEVFCFMTTGVPPMLLQDGQALWLEQPSPDAQAVLEQDLGFSVHTLFTWAQTCTLLASAADPNADQATVREEAASLLLALDTTCVATNYTSPLAPPRVQAGDMIFRHMFVCQVLLEVYGLSYNHPRIAQSVAAMLELFLETICATGHFACLLQPLLVMGSLVSEEQRDTITLLLDYARDTIGCRNINEAERLLHRVWALRDEGALDWHIGAAIRSDPSLYLLYV